MEQTNNSIGSAARRLGGSAARRLGGSASLTGLYHNLAPKARIIAISALLVLLQACGGGSSGNGGEPPMAHADCMDPAMPFFQSTEVGCRVANTNEECRMARPTMPIRVSSGDDEGSCEPATSTTQCMTVHPTAPIFVSSGDDEGSCRPQTQSECDDTDRPVLGNGACRVAEDDADCRDANTARPIFVSGGTCRAQVQVECRGTTPILRSGACRAAMSDADCAARDATLPIRDADGASCRAALESECTTAGMVLENGACVATACDTGLTRINGTCINPALFREVTIPALDTHNYDALADVGGNTAYIGANTTNAQEATTVTHGASPRAGGATADGVQLMKSGSDLTLTIQRGRTGTGFTWTAATNPRTQRTVAPEVEADTTDRRARPVADDGLAWNYPTIALNAGDLLDNLADNDDDQTAGDATEHELNVRAAVVEWTNTTDDYYMAGGVWAYDTADGTRTNRSEIVGVFADGDFTNIHSTTGNALPTSGSATYTGHSFGTYATLPAAEGEDNRGFFAAEVVINATFSSGVSTVDGRINNFLFSGRGNDADKLGFTAAGQSVLENAFTTVSVTLASDGSFLTDFDDTASGTVELDLPGTANDRTFTLSGQWGGSFFGQGHNTQDGTRAIPPGFGGTWAASGQTGTPGGASPGGFGISFIGSFGAKEVP